MKSPYQALWMRRLRRNSRPLYHMMQLVLLPLYPLWVLGLALEKLGVIAVLEKIWHYVKLPFRALWGFVKNWFASRPYGKLWLASPIMLALVVAVTIFYINANQNSSTAYQKYYQEVQDTMEVGDYKQADFLFSKIIHHPYYKDNGQVLFQALMVAQNNGNAPRMLSLRTKLIQELKYEPAMRWFAETVLQQHVPNQADSAMVVQMATEILAESKDDEVLAVWRRVLATYYMQAQEFEMAQAVFAHVEKLDVLTQLLIARIANAMGARDRAQEALHKLLAEIDRVDPAAEKFLYPKIEAIVLLAEMQADPEETERLIDQVIQIVKARKQLAADRKSFSEIEADLYGRIFYSQLQQGGKKRYVAFRSLDQALQGEKLKKKIAFVLHELIDDASKLSLLSGDIKGLAASEGGCVVHLVLGMTEWNNENRDAAMLHFHIAKEVNPSALEVLRYAAVTLVEMDKKSAENEGFLGMEKSAVNKALVLLGAVRELDGNVDLMVLFDECAILAMDNQWQAIIDRVEPRMKEMDKVMLLRAYEKLVEANRNLGRTEKAQEYEQAWYNERFKKGEKK